MSEAKRGERWSGLLTVELERLHRAMTGEQLHVWLDGLDITRRCFRVDTHVGYAMVWCEDPSAHDPWFTGGTKHLHPVYSAVCQHRLDGRVIIESVQLEW